MKLVIDENIPLGKEVFSKLGEVTLLPGRDITSEGIRDATALIVRSVTRINKDLLAGSKVQFVGTATAGIDHVDLSYLAQQQIGFADAAGANANSVAEYVLTALLSLADQHGFSLREKTLGIIGVGRIGSLVAHKARALGMELIFHDPPLKRLTDDPVYRPLKEVLQANILTFHVPLTKDGPDRTFHLLGEKELKTLSPACIVMNTSRGEVVDNSALLHSLSERRLQGAVLDVWEGEPAINWHLVQFVNIATPHIAGYSLDGKINGTKMMFQALCQYLEKNLAWDIPVEPHQPASLSPLYFDAKDKGLQKLAFELASRLYNIERDSSNMKALAKRPPSERPRGFDYLRKNYPTRREFFATPLHLQNVAPDLLDHLAKMGFHIASGKKLPKKD